MYAKSLLTACAAGAVLTLAGCSSMHNVAPSSQPLEESALATEAAKVLQRQMEHPPQNRIPHALIDDARCVGVFPSFTKVAFVVGGAQGKGIIVCQSPDGESWSNASPALYTLTGGSIGFQAGVQSSSVILLFLNTEAVQALTNPTIKFGAGISVAAGPLGWQADVQGAPAPIISYQVSTSGLFAGVNLGGSTLSFDQTSTSDIYDDQPTPNPHTVLFEMDVVPSSVNVYNQAVADFADTSR
ncbi:MAG: lipid-binding SYLF domain-containing protein [Gammaproteobacteria bacterium]|nr:lipid-binding SYLF domain-containing protein [Gammaproteobacteria bacterium]